MLVDRARFLLTGAGAAAAATLPRTAGAQTTVDMPFANGTRALVAFPQKRPLIMLTPRPPQLETPFAVFDEGVFTPNDAFFVRWHLAGIPQQVDAATHRIAVTGAVQRPLSLSMADLGAMPAVDVIAVNQCSGNSRGLSTPRVAGGQWDNGAMGNARWTGVRLRDILDRAGVTSAAKQVQFNGLDGPVQPATPDFKKSLELDHARSEDVIVAYAMNGAPLPVLNGYPVRLIVPGWFGTYWVKMLSDITVLDHVDDNYWMKSAYRIPDTPNNSVTPGATGYPTIPINRMPVRSFITNIADGATLAAGSHDVRGIAFDGGSGITRVELSADGGSTWRDAVLEQDYGRYSFRRWHANLAMRPGTLTLAVRATANDGSVQPATSGWNPGGFLRNLVEHYKVTVS